LTNYKEQGAVGMGVLVPQPVVLDPASAGVQALTMIMVLCLIVYARTRFRLRPEVQETGKTVSGKAKKDGSEPDSEVDISSASGESGKLNFKAGEAVTVIVTSHALGKFGKIPMAAQKGLQKIATYKRRLKTVD
jgi:transposase